MPTAVMTRVKDQVVITLLLLLDMKPERVAMFENSEVTILFFSGFPCLRAQVQLFSDGSSPGTSEFHHIQGYLGTIAFYLSRKVV